MLKIKWAVILILILAFTLVGNCADLFGTYDQRIKFTIDNTKIDATLTWIPITVLLTSTAGEEVFVELDADTDFDKCAFTKSDGTTELYADCEKYDVSGEVAIYHVSLDGWEISSSGDTDFYMYYDDDASSNYTYISKSAITGSKYPTAHTADYVKATTTITTYYPYNATDPERFLTGARLGQEWSSANAVVTNQRFHIDLGSAKIINKIYYENSHDSGGDTDAGVQNFTFQGSNTGAGTFDDLVYANNEGWTTLTTSQATFDEHTGSDAADPKYITVSNNTAYRYYAFKFADNHGDATSLGLRHVVLQRTTAANNVYDANFKAVYHMNDDTTSTILDSTSNANHGTKKDANEPAEAAGKVGQGQDLDGTDDYITFPCTALSTTDYTIETIFQSENSENVRIINPLSNVQYSCAFPLITLNYAGDVINCQRDAAGAYTIPCTGDADWHYITWIRTSGTITGYKDGASQVVSNTGTDYDQNGYDFTDTSFVAGKLLYEGSSYYSKGLLDEYRISNSARAAAWVKATKESLWDSLLTYGNEETSGVAAANILFTFENF